MKNKNILIDSDKIDTMLNRIEEASTSINSGVDKSKQTFSFLQNSNNLSKGVNTINNNLSFIMDRFKKYKEIILKQSSSFFEEEKLLLPVIEEIKIPTDLSVIDNVFESNTNEINVSKKEEGTIKASDTTTTVDYDDSSRISVDKIEELNNNNTEEVSYDDNNSIDKTLLTNINNNSNTLEQELNENYSEEKVNLAQNNGNSTNQVNVEFDYDLNKIKIESNNQDVDGDENDN